MSKHACKSSWPISGCHHPHQGPQKKPALHTGIGKGNENPEGRGIGKGHTALEITTAAGTHQTESQRLAGGQAVKVIEKDPHPGTVHTVSVQMGQSFLHTSCKPAVLLRGVHWLVALFVQRSKYQQGAVLI